MVNYKVLLTTKISFRVVDKLGSFSPLYDLRHLSVDGYEGTYSIWFTIHNYYPPSVPAGTVWSPSTTLHWNVGVDIPRERYSGIILQTEFKPATNRWTTRPPELLYKPKLLRL